MEEQNMMFANIVAVTSVFGLGLTMFLLGSIKLKLTETLGINDAQMGKLFSVYNFSNLVFVLVAGVVTDNFGYQTCAIVGFAAGVASMLFMGQAKTYGIAVVACLFLGVGSMFMNTAGNVLLGNPAIVFPDPGQSGNLGNVFFGVGAFVTPMLSAILFKQMSFGKALTVLGLLLVAPLVIACMAAFPESGGNFSASAAGGLITNPTIVLCALALMCYIALEVSMAGWITTYMTSVGASATQANTNLSFFSIAIMLGRLVTALGIGKLIVLSGSNGPWFILGLAAVSAVVLFAMKGINSKGSATVCVVLLGLLFAPIFPTVAGLMFARVPGEVAGTGFSIIFGVGLLGAIFVPAWMGSISSGEGKTIKDSMIVAASVAVILVVLAGVMGVMLPAPLPVA
ncbi:MAG: MFS transporter [Candidatus Hinthialibacter antarcticus]|nr:MFS transporter [Candidatus Hinthialibacter antarcticus]